MLLERVKDFSFAVQPHFTNVAITIQMFLDELANSDHLHFNDDEIITIPTPNVQITLPQIPMGLVGFPHQQGMLPPPPPGLILQGEVEFDYEDEDEGSFYSIPAPVQPSNQQISPPSPQIPAPSQVLSNNAPHNFETSVPVTETVSQLFSNILSSAAEIMDHTVSMNSLLWNGIISDDDSMDEESVSDTNSVVSSIDVESVVDSSSNVSTEGESNDEAVLVMQFETEQD